MKLSKKEGYKKYKDVIELMSERWNIPKELICGIIYTESTFDSDAKRYEPKFYDRYIKKMKLEKEEAEWRATSWGLMQILGQTARENGYRGYREDLADPVVNLYYCCKFFVRLLRRYNGNKEHAISAYNQGNNRWKDLDKDKVKDENEDYYNQYYVDKVLDYEQDFVKIVNEVEKTKEDTHTTYVVKSGDNLGKIAKLHKVNINNLIEINKIENPNLIYPGQKLIIKSINNK